MKAINLFNILSIIVTCGIINCSEENYHVYSIEYLDKDKRKQNFNYQNKDAENFLPKIKEVGLLVSKIQDICKMIETVKNNKNRYIFNEEIYEIISELKNNSYQCFNQPEHASVFYGFERTINLIDQLLNLFQNKQHEIFETVFNKSINHVVFELQDLNALSKVVEKIFNEEEGKTEASYYSYRIRQTFMNLHLNIKKICHLNQIYKNLLNKQSQYFSNEKRETIDHILFCSSWFRNMTHATNKENFVTNARTRHKNSYNFFCEYHTHFFTVKTILESIISTLDDICTCKMNINKYLELLKKGFNKNF